MKSLSALLSILALTVKLLAAQDLTLEYCLERSHTASPLNKQKLQLETIETLSHKNLNTAYLPQFNLSGQATYQSDVFSFPSNPVLETPIIPKEQYRIQIDLVQNIYDGGRSKNQKRAETARLKSENQSVRVDLYQIKSTVTRLYFGALLYQENLKILANLRAELEDQQKVLESRVRNGVIIPTVLDNFNKQILRTDQEILTSKLEKESLLELLEKWIDEDIDQDAKLQLPEISLERSKVDIQRPELEYLRSRNDYLEAMKNLSTVKRHPGINVFAQGGIGNPNPLNWLDTEFSDFYMVGIRMHWNIIDYGNAKREREIHTANQIITQSKIEHLEDQIDKQLIQENAEAEKLRQLINKDDEILSLQTKIVQRSFSQLNNGVITATDYLTELNERTIIEINRKIHQIQLLQSNYNWLNTSGNL